MFGGSVWFGELGFGPRAGKFKGVELTVVAQELWKLRRSLGFQGTLILV